MAENGGRRSGLRACGAAAAGVLTAVLLGVLGTAPAMAAPTVGRARAGTTPAATRTVTYSGYRVRVPASWPVYDLAADPSQCVLFNRHAVYLGTPGGDQRCPARAFGRTQALLIQPDGGATGLGGALPAGTVVLPRNSAALPAGASTPAPDAAGHVLRVVAPGPGVLVTASYGRDEGLVRSILAGAATTGTASSSAPATSQGAATPATEHSGSSTTYRRAPARRAPSATASPSPASASPSPAPAPAGPSAPSAELAGQQGSGLGFDTCTAPSAATMTSWLSSPYRVVGTYLGGVNWACGYGNFSAAWVSQVAAEGWRFIPIWVGLQAPCSTISGVATISPPQAAAEGQAEAASAVAAAQQFGYGAGSPVYFDMEGYSSSDTSCSAAVVTFLGAWTQGLHAAGYRSGVYSSASSGIAALAAQYGNAGYPSPDDIWIADWNGDPVLTDSAAPAADWPGRRLHQYYGAHDETWGGATVNVDDDAVGGEVAGLPAVRAGAPGAVTAEPGAATVAPGGSTTVHLVIHAGGSRPALVRWRADPPAGLTVTPSRGLALAWPGRGATATLTVRPGASLPAGRYDVPVTASAGTQRLTETFELVSMAPPAGPRIVLYAADAASMAAAAATASRLALPSGDVTGDFEQAWTDLTGGSDLVLAVGQAAMNALYNNACGWPNPAGATAGHTPFYYLGTPLRQPPGTDVFEPSDGTGPAGTVRLTAQLTHYALAGTIPDDGTRPVGPAPAADICLGAPDVPVP
jgi:hypothetical protein